LLKNNGIFVDSNIHLQLSSCSLCQTAVTNTYAKI